MSDELAKVEDYVDDELPEVRTGWQIEKLAQADWSLSRLVDFARELAELAELERQAIDRVKLRADKLRSNLQRGVRFFEATLRAWAEQNKAELLRGSKKKSRELVHGTLGWRKKGGRLLVKDEAALLEWCRKQPVETGVLRIKEEPALNAIQEHFKKTGEVPDGAEVGAEFEEFTITTAGGDHG